MSSQPTHSDSSLATRRLGDLQVGAIGLGCMPLSGMPATRSSILTDRDAAISVIHTAIDHGVTLLDTADIYAPSWDAFGHNEVLVGEAFASYPGDASRVVIATKGGITRGPQESWGRAANLDYLMRATEASLGRLGLDRIALWQHHRLDPSLPFETQFENVLVLKERGLVERIGVSNYDAEQLRRSVAIAGPGVVVSVQNQLSPKYRHDEDVLDVCHEHDIAFLPWSPLGGVREAHHLTSGISAFVEVGQARGVSPQVVALAWLMRLSPNVIPIPGATRVESIRDSVVAASVDLSDEEVAVITAALPPTEPASGELLPKPPYRS
jgi:aryl-alcohol dehydrogenase-like predicted oxidoreductase